MIKKNFAKLSVLIINALIYVTFSSAADISTENLTEPRPNTITQRSCLERIFDFLFSSAYAAPTNDIETDNAIQITPPKLKLHAFIEEIFCSEEIEGKPFIIRDAKNWVMKNYSTLAFYEADKECLDWNTLDKNIELKTPTITKEITDKYTKFIATYMATGSCFKRKKEINHKNVQANFSFPIILEHTIIHPEPITMTDSECTITNTIKKKVQKVNKKKKA
jgi:hypothetical protein